MFCSTCEQCLRNEDKFFSQCGKELCSTSRDFYSQLSCTDACSASSVTAALSNAPCTSSNDDSKAIKTFAAYRKSKGHQWKQRVSKTAGKEKEEEVAVRIGMMEVNTKESKLKPVRGKRVMLRISNKAPHSDVRALAEVKFRAYHINFYQEGEEYHLRNESGMEAQFLPGTTEFSVTMKRYREDGRDYKSHCTVLCTNQDLIASENLITDDRVRMLLEEEGASRPEKKVELTQVESDEMLVRQLQTELDNERNPPENDQLPCDVDVPLQDEQDVVTCKLPSQELLQMLDSCAALISTLREGLMTQVNILLW